MKKEIAIKFIQGLDENAKKEWLRLLKMNFFDTRYVLEGIGEDILNLNSYQIEGIKEGLKNRLAYRYILLYAKPQFDCDQMEQVRIGFENGLVMDQVAVYAKLEFNYMQMSQIRMGFEQGLSKKQIEEYAKPELEYWQMEQKRIEAMLEIIKKTGNLMTGDLLLNLLVKE